MHDLKIVFLTLSEFYLTALAEDKQEDSSNPLALVRDGVVVDTSQEAEVWGVKPGDLARQANRRCPGLQTIEFSPDDYLELYERAWSAFAAITPLVEPIDYHQGYLDVTGCALHSGCETATELMQSVIKRLFESTSIRCSWGGGCHKWIARLARNENGFIRPGQEHLFLDRLPVSQLAITEDWNERFRRYGICTVAQLMNVPDSFLQSHLQLSKQELQQLRIRDSTPVRALFPAAKLEDKEILLWTDEPEIESAVHNLSERLSRELESRSLQAGMILLTVETRQEDIIQEHKLSRPCSSEEHLSRLLHDLLPDKQKEQWREIRVTLSNLTPRFRPQVDLWQNKHSITEVNHPLQTASERLQKKFGSQVLRSGTEYSHSVSPRFAQLIYELRGINLP